LKLPSNNEQAVEATSLSLYLDEQFFSSIVIAAGVFCVGGVEDTTEKFHVSPGNIDLLLILLYVANMSIDEATHVSST
jgi:hypothetical protein